MARLIIHSDDFGLHRNINSAIIKCAEKGVLTSASLLANGLAANEAVSAAIALPQLGIGAHLNIVRGKPLSPPAEISSLVDSQGKFFNSMTKLLFRSKLGLLKTEHLYTEYRRQLLFLLDNGITPTHVDSEKHSHLLLPQAAQAIDKVCKEFKITRIRNVKELSTLQLFKFHKEPGNLTQTLKLHFLERCAKKCGIPWNDYKTVDGTLGVRMSGEMNEDQALSSMSQVFKDSRNLTIEWIFHIGEPLNFEEIKAEFGSFFLTQQRQLETNFLLSDSVKLLIAENRSNLVSYRDL